jgi:hypothetical protein
MEEVAQMSCQFSLIGAQTNQWAQRHFYDGKLVASTPLRAFYYISSHRHCELLNRNFVFMVWLHGNNA